MTRLRGRHIQARDWLDDSKSSHAYHIKNHPEGCTSVWGTQQVVLQ